MTIYPRIQLSRLREIGWKCWDPIGLAEERDAYPEGCADEYDSYLLHAVSLICRGRSTQEVADYLRKIESENMGLSIADAGAALATSQAIADYLSSLPDGPKAVD